MKIAIDPLKTGSGHQEPPAYFSKQQIADRLGVSVRTIENMMAARRLPYVRISRKLVRFPVAEVDEFIARNLKVNAVGEEGGER